MSKNKKASTEVKQNLNKPAPEITGTNSVSAPGFKKPVMTAEEIEKAKAEIADLKAKEKALREALKENNVSTKTPRGPSAKTFITEIYEKAPADAKPTADQIARQMVGEHLDITVATINSSVQKFFTALKGPKAKDEEGIATDEAK